METEQLNNLCIAIEQYENGEIIKIPKIIQTEEDFWEWLKKQKS